MLLQRVAEDIKRGYKWQVRAVLLGTISRTLVSTLSSVFSTSITRDLVSGSDEGFWMIFGMVVTLGLWSQARRFTSFE